MAVVLAGLAAGWQLALQTGDIQTSYSHHGRAGVTGALQVATLLIMTRLATA